ncbi:MAG: hypothetical protein AAGI07_08220 [Bacteroidota bacterium]
MDKIKFSKLALIKSALWGVILLSILALVYHVRWFLPFLLNSVVYKVPSGQSPITWFSVQIFSNIIFLFMGYLLIRLFNKYKQLGYSDRDSLKVFDVVIISCLCLTILGVVKIAFSEFYPLPLNEYKTLWGGINLVAFLIIDTVTIKEPQTMYLLLAIILWAVKQFVIKALFVESENEAFI